MPLSEATISVIEVYDQYFNTIEEQPSRTLLVFEAMKSVKETRDVSHLSLLKVAGDTTHGELQPGLGALGHRLLGCLSLAAT